MVGNIKRRRPISPQLSKMRGDKDKQKFRSSLHLYRRGPSSDWLWTCSIKARSGSWSSSTTTPDTPNSKHCKSVFACHGISEVVWTTARSILASKDRSFQPLHESTVSNTQPPAPTGPRAVEWPKLGSRLLSHVQDGDPHTTLLAYRTTPLKNGYGPTHLLSGNEGSTACNTRHPRSPKI